MRGTCITMEDYRNLAMVYDAFLYSITTRFILFTKSEWIEDVGFLLFEKKVVLPSYYDTDEIKSKFYSECLELLNTGWVSNYIDNNKEAAIRFMGAPLCKA